MFHPTSSWWSDPINAQKRDENATREQDEASYLQAARKAAAKALKGLGE